MTVAYIALGSNLGDRAAYLVRARTAIAEIPHTKIVGSTPEEDTEPLGDVAQPRFLNQMLVVETDLEPLELLEHLQSIELDCGRERTRRWGPRTLDLDIVFMEGVAVHEPRLTVPHPELRNREFWLRQLSALRRGREP